MKPIFLVAAGVLVLAAGEGVGSDTGAPAAGVVHQTVVVGVGADVWYYLPKSGVEGLLPLVYSFHGASERGSQEIARWTALAEKHGFAVVCPTSKAAGAYVKPATALQLVAEDYRNEVLVAESMLGQLAAHRRLHPALRMVSGFSGGGNPAYYLAFTRPDLFPMLAARSANFPGESVLGGRGAAGVQSASKASRILIYWGERDHPIIRQDAPVALRWVESLRPAFLTSKVIPGMGHEPRPEIAADWFEEQHQERRKLQAVEGVALHRKAMEQGAVALRSRDYALALRAYAVAAQWELEMPSLGTNALNRVERLEAHVKRAPPTRR